MLSLWSVIKGLLVQEESDRTKELSIEVDATATTATRTTLKSAQSADRTVNLPDADDTLVGRDTTDTLTNKTIDGDDNTVQDLALASLKTDAPNANKFLQRDGSGDVVASKDVPAGDVVGNSDTQTLTNKTIDGTSATGTNTVTADANDITYDNSTSGLTATDLQAGVDEVEGRLDTAETNISTNASNLSNHLADAVDAHDASAISFDNAASGLTAIEVQAAIDEVEGRLDTNETGLSDHLADAVDAHDASAISYDNSTSGLTATEVQAAVDEVEGRLDSAETSITSLETALPADNDYLQLEEQASTPSTPAAGLKLIYPKTDGKVYTLDDAGVELELGGGSGLLEVRTITASATILSTDDVVLVDTALGNVTATLPSAVGLEGKVLLFKLIDATNTLTIDGDGSETIEGSTTRDVVESNRTFEIVSDGSNWVISVRPAINRRQQKNLGSAVSSITTRTNISGLNFNNLRIGSNYRVYVAMDVQTDSNAPNGQAYIEHNGSDIARWNIRDDSHGSNRLEAWVNMEATFTAASSTVEVDFLGAAGTWQVNGNGTPRTFSYIEEIPEQITTTDYT